MATPDMDFETYSEAGYKWDGCKWVSIDGGRGKGLKSVGTPAYSEHPSTEVLSLAYDLKDGLGGRLWVPGMQPPTDLFDHIARGGVVEAHNSSFEWYIWQNVCHARMGWPSFPIEQTRDSSAKCASFSIPRNLKDAGAVMNIKNKKIEDGTRLLNKFSMPRNPTKSDPRRRITPSEEPVDAALLYGYNVGDIVAESELSGLLPDLSPAELELWIIDQRINTRGVAIDLEALRNLISVVESVTESETLELNTITGGQIKSPSEVAKTREFLASVGVHITDLTSETVGDTLKRGGLPTVARRVLEIRESLGSASVKKLFSIARRVSRDGRLRDMFVYCGASNTGRFSGKGPQPQNLPNSGPQIVACSSCGVTAAAVSLLGKRCPACQIGEFKKGEWGVEAVEDFFSTLSGRYSLNYRELYPDPIAAVSGSLRALFVAGEGKELICSDYTAIEAVVLAAMAGEEWRMEVFRSHGKIYEMSASKITGIPFEEFLRHKQETGDHHPMRKKIGKVAELASGYQGGHGAWCNFGADQHLSTEEIKASIAAWRKESPMIVSFWYGVEEAATMAVQFPGSFYQYRGVSFGVKDDILHCKLPSGRMLRYHNPRLVPDVTAWGKQVMKITHMGIDSKTKRWVRMSTYGGKLTENIVQAVARDILANAIINLEKSGYPVIMHVHDEIISEVTVGSGSVKEFETIMGSLPEWCKDWPVRAAGGWRGHRYRKD